MWYRFSLEIKLWLMFFFEILLPFSQYNIKQETFHFPSNYTDLSDQLVNFWGSARVAYPFGCQTSASTSQAVSTRSQLLVNKYSPRTQHLIGSVCIPKFLLKLDFLSHSQIKQSQDFPRITFGNRKRFVQKWLLKHLWVPLSSVIAVIHPTWESFSSAWNTASPIPMLFCLVFCNRMSFKNSAINTIWGYWRKQQDQRVLRFYEFRGQQLDSLSFANNDAISAGCTGQKCSSCHCFHFSSSKQGTLGRKCEWQVLSHKLKTQLSYGHNKSSHLLGVYCVPGAEAKYLRFLISFHPHRDQSNKWQRQDENPAMAPGHMLSATPLCCPHRVLLIGRHSDEIRSRKKYM